MAYRLTLGSRWISKLTSRLRIREKVASRSGSSAHAETPTSGPEPPNGFLFNEKPLRPGEKRQKEDWENIWVYGMTFNLLLAFAVVVFKPDTSISSWGREKALERLKDKENSAGSGESGSFSDDTAAASSD